MPFFRTFHDRAGKAFFLGNEELLHLVQYSDMEVEAIKTALIRLDVQGDVQALVNDLMTANADPTTVIIKHLKPHAVMRVPSSFKTALVFASVAAGWAASAWSVVQGEAVSFQVSVYSSLLAHLTADIQSSYRGHYQRSVRAASGYLLNDATSSPDLALVLNGLEMEPDNLKAVRQQLEKTDATQGAIDEVIKKLDSAQDSPSRADEMFKSIPQEMSRASDEVVILVWSLAKGLDSRGIKYSAKDLKVLLTFDEELLRMVEFVIDTVKVPDVHAIVMNAVLLSRILWFMEQTEIGFLQDWMDKLLLLPYSELASIVMAIRRLPEAQAVSMLSTLAQDKLQRPRDIVLSNALRYYAKTKTPNGSDIFFALPVVGLLAVLSKLDPENIKFVLGGIGIAVALKVWRKFAAASRLGDVFVDLKSLQPESCEDEIKKRLKQAQLSLKIRQTANEVIQADLNELESVFKLNRLPFDQKNIGKVINWIDSGAPKVFDAAQGKRLIKGPPSILWWVVAPPIAVILVGVLGSVLFHMNNGPKVVLASELVGIFGFAVRYALNEKYNNKIKAAAREWNSIINSDTFPKELVDIARFPAGQQNGLASVDDQIQKVLANQRLDDTTDNRKKLEKELNTQKGSSDSAMWDKIWHSSDMKSAQAAGVQIYPEGWNEERFNAFIIELGNTREGAISKVTHAFVNSGGYHGFRITCDRVIPTAYYLRGEVKQKGVGGVLFNTMDLQDEETGASGVFVEVLVKPEAFGSFVLILDQVAKGSFDQMLKFWLQSDTAQDVSHDTDAAMDALVNGGIDLDRAKLDLNVRKEGAGVEMQIDPAMAERIRREGVSGLVPEILEIKVLPMQGLFQLLGM